MSVKVLIAALAGVFIPIGLVYLIPAKPTPEFALALFFSGPIISSCVAVYLCKGE